LDVVEGRRIELVGRIQEHTELLRVKLSGKSIAGCKI
jgi:hypothetical protein